MGTTGNFLELTSWVFAAGILCIASWRDIKIKALEDAFWVVLIIGSTIPGVLAIMVEQKITSAIQFAINAALVGGISLGIWMIGRRWRVQLMGDADLLAFFSVGIVFYKNPWFMMAYKNGELLLVPPFVNIVTNTYILVFVMMIGNLIKNKITLSKNATVKTEFKELCIPWSKQNTILMTCDRVRADSLHDDEDFKILVQVTDEKTLDPFYYMMEFNGKNSPETTCLMADLHEQGIQEVWKKIEVPLLPFILLGFLMAATLGNLFFRLLELLA